MLMHLNLQIYRKMGKLKDDRRHVYIIGKQLHITKLDSLLTKLEGFSRGETGEKISGLA